MNHATSIEAPEHEMPHCRKDVRSCLFAHQTELNQAEMGGVLKERKVGRCAGRSKIERKGSLRLPETKETKKGGIEWLSNDRCARLGKRAARTEWRPEEHNGL